MSKVRLGKRERAMKRNAFDALFDGHRAIIQANLSAPLRDDQPRIRTSSAKMFTVGLTSNSIRMGRTGGGSASTASGGSRFARDGFNSAPRCQGSISGVIGFSKPQKG